MTASLPAPSAAAARRLQRISELAEMAMELARITLDQARRLAEANAAPETVAQQLPALTRGFDRLARTIRLTSALEQKFEHDKAAFSSEPRRTAARQQVIRRAEDMIELRAEPAEREHLLADLYERLDDPGFDLDLALREVGEVIDEVCRDLGVGPVKPNYGKPRPPAALRVMQARASKQGQGSALDPLGQGDPRPHAIRASPS
jgi:nucleotide-binding universal stress UspA family protein